jgi:hypothetical protein
MDNPTSPISDVHEELVEATVECLIEAYITLRRRWLPDYRGVQGKDRASFYQVSKVLAKHNLDPYAFASFVFDKITKVAVDVYPNQITSINLALEFAEQRPLIKDKIDLIVQLQFNSIATRLKNGDKLEDILHDRYAELSAVVRYATAWSEGLTSISEEFLEDAERMIMFEPYYVELLGKWLPEGLRRV